MDRRDVSRDELYDLVWARPMIHVASEFGISGNGLAKVCRKLEVPYPPRGYWAKHSVGRAPPPPGLPPLKRSTPDKATVTATVAERVDDAASEMRRNRDAALKRVGEVEVPERLTRPHPIIATWIEDKKRQRTEAARQRDPWLRNLHKVEDFSDADRRRHRILTALFRALECEGGSIVQKARRELRYEAEGESIEFQLREKLKQVRRPLSESEKQWSFYSDRGWRQELEPTGKLIFEFKSYLADGLRRNWLETDAKPMEAMLPEIVATFVLAIPLLIEARAERVIVEQRWREAEQCRRAEEERRQIDEARWRKLVNLAAASREADLARQFLTRLKTSHRDLSVVAGGQTVEDWVAWAEERIIARDPLCRAPEVVFDEIAHVDPRAYRS